MLEILREIGIEPMRFLIVLLLSLVVMVFAYKPFVIGLLDPLNVFILTMCANSVLMFGLDWDRSATIEFAIFSICLWIGFASTGKIPRIHPTMIFNSDSLFELEIILVLTAAVIAIANIYLGITAGFPMLSADPSISKVTTFTGGLGAIRHLNMGPSLFLCCGCILLIAIGESQSLALLLLVVTSGFLALSGSKGALLPILFALAFVIHHNRLGGTISYIRKIKKFTLPAFATATAVAVAVAVRDNGGILAGIIFLAKRLLFFGDVILFYYPRRGAIPELAGVGPLNYPEYLFGSVLGMFRFIDYPPALGTIIAAIEDGGFGPNVQYFVRADIFFGPVWGCLYCFMIGWTIGWLRRKFFTCRTNDAAFFTFILTGAVSALVLASESQLFVTEIFDALLFICPLWCVARVIRLATVGPHKITKAVV